MTKKEYSQFLKHVLMILLCLAVVLPFYLVVINSFKTKGRRPG